MRIQTVAVVLGSFMFFSGCARPQQTPEKSSLEISAPTRSETDSFSPTTPNTADSISPALNSEPVAQTVPVSELQNAPDVELVRQSKWIVDLADGNKISLTDEIYVPWMGAGVPQGYKGIVLLDADARVISYGMFDLRQVRRQIGGLPAIDPIPTDAELAALAQRVAVVAVGRLTSVDDQFATFSPTAIFKGTDVPLWMPVGLDGSHPSEREPGSRWRLSTDFQSSVVLFLNGPSPTGQWWIENLVEPDRVSVEQITKLLGTPIPVD